MPAGLAARYANALADVTASPAAGVDAAAALDQLRQFRDMVKATPELHAVLMSPAVTTARKRAVVSQLVEMMHASRPVRNFLFVVIDHRRVAMLDEIARAFEDVVDARASRVRADVRSARPLTDSQKAALGSELTRLSGKQVRCEFELDDSLLGGVIAQVGSTVYDGSVRGRLEGLRRRLTK